MAGLCPNSNEAIPIDANSHTPIPIDANVPNGTDNAIKTVVINGPDGRTLKITTDGTDSMVIYLDLLKDYVNEQFEKILPFIKSNIRLVKILKLDESIPDNEAVPIEMEKMIDAEITSVIVPYLERTFFILLKKVENHPNERRGLIRRILESEYPELMLDVWKKVKSGETETKIVSDIETKINILVDNACNQILAEMDEIVTAQIGTVVLPYMEKVRHTLEKLIDPYSPERQKSIKEIVEADYTDIVDLIYKKVSNKESDERIFRAIESKIKARVDDANNQIDRSIKFKKMQIRASKMQKVPNKIVSSAETAMEQQISDIVALDKKRAKNQRNNQKKKTKAAAKKAIGLVSDPVTSVVVSVIASDLDQKIDTTITKTNHLFDHLCSNDWADITDIDNISTVFSVPLVPQKISDTNIVPATVDSNPSAPPKLSQTDKPILAKLFDNNWADETDLNETIDSDTTEATDSTTTEIITADPTDSTTTEATDSTTTEATESTITEPTELPAEKLTYAQILLNSRAGIVIPKSTPTKPQKAIIVEKPHEKPHENPHTDIVEQNLNDKSHQNKQSGQDTKCPITKCDPVTICNKYEFTKIFAGTEYRFVNMDNAQFYVGDNTDDNPWLVALLNKIDKPFGYKIRFRVYGGKYEAIIMAKESNKVILLQHKKDHDNKQIKTDERWIRITI